MKYNQLQGTQCWVRLPRNVLERACAVEAQALFPECPNKRCGQFHHNIILDGWTEAHERAKL